MGSKEQMRFIRLKEMGTGFKPEKMTWDGMQSVLSECFADRTAAAFVAMTHGICMGIWEKGCLIMPSFLPLESSYLKSARLFDQESECHIWKSDLDAPNIFNLRIRQEREDEAGEIEAVRARQLLWGTRLEECKEDQEWNVLKEDRGIELLIHKDLIPAHVTVDRENRLWLITNNYIDYNPLGQAGYIDCRFVAIEGERG